VHHRLAEGWRDFHAVCRHRGGGPAELSKGIFESLAAPSPWPRAPSRRSEGVMRPESPMASTFSFRAVSRMDVAGNHHSQIDDLVVICRPIPRSTMFLRCHARRPSPWPSISCPPRGVRVPGLLGLDVRQPGTATAVFHQRRALFTTWGRNILTGAKETPRTLTSCRPSAAPRSPQGLGVLQPRLLHVRVDVVPGCLSPAHG